MYKRRSVAGDGGEMGCQRIGSDSTREEWVVSRWQNNIDPDEWLEVEFRG